MIRKAFAAYANRSGGQLGSVVTAGRGRLGLLDRSAPHRHADQQDRHRPAGEQGELRIMATAERTGDAQAEQGDDRGRPALATTSASTAASADSGKDP